MTNERSPLRIEDYPAQHATSEDAPGHLLELLMTLTTPTAPTSNTLRRSAQVFAGDVFNGLVSVSHNSLALLGLSVIAGVAFVAHHADMRTTMEEEALDWLLTRQEARLEVKQMPADEAQGASALLAVERATATDPAALDRQQSAVANWLSRRYHVALEPVSALVQEAWAQGKRNNMDPLLILGVMAIESSFNPFAQSPVGAQGLMQVLTRVHDDKYEAFGGNHAAFDPLTNLRVGVVVLRECIDRAGGSVEGGLRNYVGAANLPDDGGYAARVLGEAQWLQDVAKGRQVPWTIKAGVASSGNTGGTSAPAAASVGPVKITPVASSNVSEPRPNHSNRLALLR